MRDLRGALALLCLPVLALGGCGDDDASGTACVPGESIACVGPGGCSGGQVCLPDGSGYGACDCGGAGMDAGDAMDAGDGEDAGSTGDDAGSMEDASATGDGGSDAGSDAGPDPDACDPVANTGCGADEKCAWRVESVDPYAGRTTCVPEGSVSIGDPCTREDVADGGHDDCVEGAICVAGECLATCDETSDTCGAGFHCQGYAMLFADRDDVGVCEPDCNLITQDCDSGEGCYLDLTSGDPGCSSPAAGAESKGQGDDCEFINDCPIGYGCHLNNDPTSPTGLLCAYYCGAGGAGGPSCTDTGGPGAGYGCESLQTLYTGLPSSIPDAVGICVPCADYPSAPGCS